MSEKERQSGEHEYTTGQAPILPTVNPALEKTEPSQASIHPAFYIATWIALSSSVILFNKYILHTLKFEYPIILTTWHLVFSTVMTQLMARFTTMLDSRKKVPMTGRIYLRSIVPIGVLFSLSLICSNLTYLYLSVSFIQMLKATMPIAVLLISWVMGVSPPSFKTLGNVSLIVVGVIIASFAEVQLVFLGVMFQVAGIVFEAVRLVLVQQLLSGDFKMDPLVSVYYFAPACAVMNGVIALVLEVPKLSMADYNRVGGVLLVANAAVAFALNIAVVFLIGKTSSLAMTLSGVLKDILLVVASIVIFGDPVNRVQFFGYSIALCGLVYYRLGSEQFKEHLGQGQRAWADFGNRRPALRRVIVFAGALIVIVLLLSGTQQTGVLSDTSGSWNKAVSHIGH